MQAGSTTHGQSSLFLQPFSDEPVFFFQCAEPVSEDMTMRGAAETLTRDQLLVEAQLPVCPWIEFVSEPESSPVFMELCMTGLDQKPMRWVHFI